MELSTRNQILTVFICCLVIGVLSTYLSWTLVFATFAIICLVALAFKAKETDLLFLYLIGGSLGDWDFRVKGISVSFRDIIFGTIVVVWFVKFKLKGKISNPVTLFLFFLILSSLLTGMLTWSSQYSKLIIWEHGNALRILIETLFIVIMTNNILTDNKQTVKILRFIYLSGMISLSLNIFQKTATENYREYFLLIAVLLGQFLFKFDKKYKGIYFLGFIIIIVNLLHFYSRSTLLGTGVAVLFYFLFASKKKLLKIIPLMILVMFISRYASSQTILRAESIVNPQEISYTYDRFIIWKDALRMGLDNPILGVGYGDYAVYSNVYEYKTGFDPNSDPELYSDRIKQGHNQYLTLFAETGIIGECWFIFILILVFKKAHDIFKNANTKPDKDFGLMIMAILVGVAIMNVPGEFILPRSPLWIGSSIPVWILFNHVVNLRTERTEFIE